MLQPQLTKEIRDLLETGSQSYSEMFHLDPDFDSWTLQAAYRKDAHGELSNFVKALHDKFGHGAWKFHQYTLESHPDLVPFFEALDAFTDYVDEDEGTFVNTFVLWESEEMNHDIAVIYSCSDYCVELSDGGLGVYYRRS